MQKYIENIKDKTMPGIKKMPQDKKDYKSKAAMKDGQDTLNTMQPRKGGIYMDREDGKLPMDRVSKYYQDTNPEINQDALQSLKNVGEGFKFGAKSFGSGLADLGSSLYETGKSAVSAAANSPVGKAIGATVDYVSGQKEKEANEAQKKYNEKRKKIMGSKG